MYIWILALLVVTNAASVAITIHCKDSSRDRIVETRIEDAGDQSFLDGFDTGWAAANSDVTTVRASYEKMFPKSTK